MSKVQSTFGLLNSNGCKSNNKLLNLGIGQPLLSDFPQSIFQELQNVKNINLYYPTLGDAELRLKILERYYPNLEINNIAITNGAIGALDITLRAMVQQNSEILLPDPGFPPYKELSHFSSYKIRYYSFLSQKSSSLINWNLLNKTITSNTRLIVLNSPHNPTGRILTTKDIDELKQLLKTNKNLFFVMDEVYRDLIFEQHKHVDLTPLIDRGFIIGSFSKMYPLQGLRIGWLLSTKSLIDKVYPYFQNAHGSISSVGQELSKIFLTKNIDYYPLYEKNRELVKNKLNELKLQYIDPIGAFYYFIHIGSDDIEFCKQLLSRGVIVVPGSFFGNEGKGYLRISFAQDIKTIYSALQIISSSILELDRWELRC